MRSPLNPRLVCAPGNPGIAGLCEIRPVRTDDIAGLVALAREMPADLVVIGPDAVIAAGLADRLAEANIACFGPTMSAGRLESSKAFAKAFATRHGLPAGRFAVCDDAASAKAALRANAPPYVIKADGLAAGKGVTVAPHLATAAADIAAMFERRAAAPRVRQRGHRGVPGRRGGLEPVRAERRRPPRCRCAAARRTTSGPTTAIEVPTPAGWEPTLPRRRSPRTDGRANPRAPHRPHLRGDGAREGAPYRGVLFCEAMITADGPKLIEFNVPLRRPRVPGADAGDEERPRTLPRCSLRRRWPVWRRSRRSS